MALVVHPSRAQPVKNILLVLASVIFSLVIAEAAVRYIDGYAMLAFPLDKPVGSMTVGQELLDQIPLASGVEREWFLSDPPALPNRRAVPDEWRDLSRFVEDNSASSAGFQSLDLFKAWNSAFAGDPCKHSLLRQAPGQLFTYDPPDGNATPPYRYLPDATFPSGLVTNQIGWRGAPIENPRGEQTVRIVVVGSSTVLGAQQQPFSWPEYVGHWLNLWAKSKHLPVRFEVLNAGRESIASTDIAAVVRTEVLPLRPDLVVYNEGGNQFRPESIVEGVPEGPALRPASTDASPRWLQRLARYSAVMARVQAALRASANGHERPKPDYKVVWPTGLDEFDPDLSYPYLPVKLNIIQRDLDRIRADLAATGSELAMSSFMWMVKDGLVLDPVRHKYILEQLNIANYPFRYRELERLATFQNRVFAKYAAVHGLPFIDIAGKTPFDPDLFVDAVHPNYAGVRIRGWVAFNQLLPTVEKHLADGSWPRPWPAGVPPALPTFTSRRITFDCRS
jgi:hypothetical protein